MPFVLEDYKIYFLTLQSVMKYSKSFVKPLNPLKGNIKYLFCQFLQIFREIR